MPPSSLPRAAKRRKISETSNGNEKAITDLEARLTSAVAAKQSLNPLADLLDLTFTLSDPALLHKAVYSLYRVFVLVVSEGLLDVRGEDEEARVVRGWLQDRLAAYADFLLSLLKDEEQALRTSALRIALSLLKHLSTSLSKTSGHPQFHVPFYKRIIEALLVAPKSHRPGSSNTEPGVIASDVCDAFVKPSLNVYDDLRWFFLRDCDPILAQSLKQKHAHAHENLLSLLENLDNFPREPKDIKSWWVEEMGAKPPKPKKGKGVSTAPEEDDEQPEQANEDGEEEDDWRKFFDEPSEKDDGKKKSTPTARLHKMTVHQSLHALPSHRAVFTRAWLGLLPRLRTNSSLALRALGALHQRVMPNLTRAAMLMDWVGECVDFGGVVGLLALNALFILMTEYNLDYPVFYTRLYAFLDKDLLHLKHRARFFRLAELFLSSTHLPATLLGSFVKRLARLALSAPPAGIVITIPFIYNILKRHPALMVMIHREADDDTPSAAYEDPFKADEPDPNATDALDSSLWELRALQRHYLPGVASLTKVFGEAFTKPPYSLEDFLDHTYATLLEADFKRRIKKEPAVADALEKRLFTIEGVGADEVAAEADPIAGLWVFSQ
ncbi:CBF-domain-containing protein [Peniophora sp. CONT]|nr:CBF-domain-containing protein [Peniophora sp. CONT]